MGNAHSENSWVIRHVAGAVPHLFMMIDEIPIATQHLTNWSNANWNSENAETAASARILSLTISGLKDLMVEATAGQGRPAMRTARTLIENAIHLGCVSNDEKLAARYNAQADFFVTSWFRAQEDLMHPAPQRTSGNPDRSNLKKEADQRIQEAKQVHNGLSESGWIGGLKAKAKKTGLSELFDNNYPLLSATVHGNAAAADMGAIFNVDNQQVLRTGNAISLGAIAAHAGLKAVRATVEFLPRLDDSLETGQVLALVSCLESCLVDLHRSLEDTSRRLCLLDVGGMPLWLHVNRVGLRAWYVLDVESESVSMTERPELTGKQSKFIRTATRSARTLTDRRALVMLKSNPGRAQTDIGPWLPLEQVVLQVPPHRRVLES